LSSEPPRTSRGGSVLPNIEDKKSEVTRRPKMVPSSDFSENIPDKPSLF